MRHHYSMFHKVIYTYQRSDLSLAGKKSVSTRNAVKNWITTMRKLLLSSKDVPKLLSPVSSILTSLPKSLSPNSANVMAIRSHEGRKTQEGKWPRPKDTVVQSTKLLLMQFWLEKGTRLLDLATPLSYRSKRSRSMEQTSNACNNTDKVLGGGGSGPKVTEEVKTIATKMSLAAVTHNLFTDLAVAESNMARLVRVENLCGHLRQYPDSKALAAKIGGIRQLQLLKSSLRDPTILEGVREALALLGHCEQPKGWGIRILSIDGGGLRGILALEVLRRFEQLTGHPVHDMFDYICGVSTGAIITVLLGALKSSVTECEVLYKRIGTSIFKQNPIWGTGKLFLSHAFYDTANWTKLIQENIGSQRLIETRRDDDCPKMAAVSAVVNHSQLRAFIFRNYDYPARVQSQYPGSHSPYLWESIRASAAAPGYFEEYQLGGDVHQDGGILVNNPTAIALHECKHLWPKEEIQCVVSLGCGRYEPLPVTQTPHPSPTGLKTKLLKILDSATDTEAVHTTLHDLLPPSVYFRINPYITENVPMNESRMEKIEKLQQDARMYLRRNEEKVQRASKLLMQPRTNVQSLRDYVQTKRTQLFG